MNITAEAREANRLTGRILDGDLGWRRGISILGIALALHACLLGLAALFRLSPVLAEADEGAGPDDATEMTILSEPEPMDEPQTTDVDDDFPRTDFVDVTPEPKPIEVPRPTVAIPAPPRSLARTHGVPVATRGSSSNFASNSPTGWSTPKPVYPFQARRQHLQGSGGVRVTTNSIGRVISAEMQPGIAPMLDAAAVSHALLAWSGPPNCTRVVQITFVLE